MKQPKKNQHTAGQLLLPVGEGNHTPLRDFICPNCNTQAERFYHSTQEPATVACSRCGQSGMTVLERSDEGARRFTGVFPFVTTHIDAKGRPMEITSMAHLRQVERQYGVALSAFHNDQNNSVDGLKGELPQYRGWDLERQSRGDRRGR